MPARSIAFVIALVAAAGALVGCQSASPKATHRYAYTYHPGRGLESHGGAPLPAGAEAEAGKRPGESARPGAGEAMGVITHNPAGAQDRSNWPVLTVRLPVGPTVHRPTYTRDVPLGADGPDAVTTAPSVPRRMAEALAGARAGQWDKANAEAAALAPLRFAAALVLLPVRLVRQPPWTAVSTPPRQKSSGPESSGHAPQGAKNEGAGGRESGRGARGPNHAGAGT